MKKCIPIYYFDEDGIFLGTFEGLAGGLPPDNGTYTAPPSPVPEGNAWKINDSRDGWIQIEDHRGREGYVDGEWLRIEKAGPLPGEWSDEPPIPADTRTSMEKRRNAYMTEADPFFHEAQYYETEADGLKALGNFEGAAQAEAKANSLKRQYATVKGEIRARFPDATYCLNASGTYHMPGCSYASESGEILTLDVIVAKVPDAKQCQRCNPPALSEKL